MPDRSSPLLALATICLASGCASETLLPTKRGGDGAPCLPERTVIAALEVSAHGIPSSTPELAAGDYELVASGTYVYRPGDCGVADAAYSLRCPNETALLEGAAYAPWVGGHELPVPGYLSLRVNGVAFDWGGELREDHTYSAIFASPGGAIELSIVDDAYDDNVGALAVDVYARTTCD